MGGLENAAAVQHDPSPTEVGAGIAMMSVTPGMDLAMVLGIVRHMMERDRGI